MREIGENETFTNCPLSEKEESLWYETEKKDKCVKKMTTAEINLVTKTSETSLNMGNFSVR